MNKPQLKQPKQPESKCIHKDNHLICAKVLKANKILPKCPHATIGSECNKFKKIYAEEIYVDQDTIHFGENVDLSTSSDGNFYCTVNGQTKMFKYETNEDLTGPPGPAGPVGSAGPAGPVGPAGPKGDPGLQPSIPVNMGDNSDLLVEDMRDVPSQGLSLVFYNKHTSELSYDGNMPSYADLVQTVNDLQQELTDLKTSLE